MKPACSLDTKTNNYIITNDCIDPTPDGKTCFSYTHCLNVRSGQTGIIQPEPIQKLPRVGSEVNLLLPLIVTIILLVTRHLFYKLKNIY